MKKDLQNHRVRRLVRLQGLHRRDPTPQPPTRRVPGRRVRPTGTDQDGRL
jgi:hypothetical protein